MNYLNNLIVSVQWFVRRNWPTPMLMDISGDLVLERRPQGCGRRAYMDVLAAFPEPNPH